MANILDAPRWPGGPKICRSANLPAFDNERAMKEFQDSMCGSAMASWLCSECGRWHYWATPYAPAGGSSGTTRAYQIPERIRLRILKTRGTPTTQAEP